MLLLIARYVSNLINEHYYYYYYYYYYCITAIKRLLLLLIVSFLANSGETWVCGVDGRQSTTWRSVHCISGVWRKHWSTSRRLYTKTRVATCTKASCSICARSMNSSHHELLPKNTFCLDLWRCTRATASTWLVSSLAEVSERSNECGWRTNNPLLACVPWAYTKLETTCIKAIACLKLSWSSWHT